MSRSRDVARWLGLAVALLAHEALATSAADVCAPSTDPCIVDRTVTVSAGSTLDFGDRALEVRRTGTLDVGGGAMTVRARDVRLLPGASILGRGTTAGSVLVVATGAIAVEASGTSQARVDVSGDAGGGRIELRAGGAVTLAGALTARGATTAARGGTVIVRAGGDLTVSGSVTASGGSQQLGGDIDLGGGGELSVSGPIDASGGSGGGGSIALDGRSVTSSARLDASARTGSGDGGAVTVAATGSVALRGPIAAGSSCTVLAGCGSTGGELTIDADGMVTIGAQVTLSGAGPDGTGGTLEIDAGSDVVQSAAILVEGRGSDGCGGEASITAGRNASLGSIDLSGGFCGGGMLAVEAGGTASLAGDVGADSRSSGSGGEISLSAGHVAVTGKVHASGPSLQGGEVAVDGCDVDIGSGAQVQTRGTQGANLFAASGQLTVAGLLSSGTGTSGAGGRNLLRFRDPAKPPVVAATASIVPAPLVTNDPTLPACGNTLPPGCGNGQLDPGEACDDGNTAACDGCSAGCALEACGNGVRECAEGCDDGNLLACDGCSAGCRVERCGNGTLECGEECDAGSANGTPGAGCDATCHLPPPPGCGDGRRDAGEECDDGNLVACDGCSATCRIEGCGNGVRECGEQCDDANGAACDGCTSCRVETCGDGIRECDEECDDGAANGTPGAACDLSCHRAVVCAAGTEDPSCIPCRRDTDCDPQGRCAGQVCDTGTCTSTAPLDCNDGRPGTLDRCVVDEEGAATCTHVCLADDGCNDGEVCNGAERCSEGVCIPGAAPDCDDGDPCTDDACDSPRGCVHTARPGFDAIGCSLEAMRAAVAGATPEELSPRLRRSLVARLARLHARLDAVAAARAATDVRRERRLLARVSSVLLRIGNPLGRARRRGRIDPILGDRLATSLARAYRAVGERRAALTPSRAARAD